MLIFWEALEPSPPPTREIYTTDPRIGRARKQMDLLYSLSPRLATAHEFEAESPESTRVHYELTVELAMPLPGLVKRRAAGLIMGSALKELKAQVDRVA